MDMTPQTAWLIAISAVVIVGVVAFFIGRSTAGTKARIDELEAELSSKKAEVEGYRKEVEQHFDQTATLFVSMAGSYRDMFEHLSSGYEKLSTGSARELFQQRVDALLIGTARSPGAGDEAGKLLAGAAAAGAMSAAAAAETAPTTDGPTTEPETDVARAAPAGQVGAEAETPAEPERQSEPGPDVGEKGAFPERVEVGAEGSAADAARELPPSAADESDDRVRKAEGIAFDPTIDEAPVRGDAARS